nr:NADH dehydrogenase subunit 2 [Dikraneura zlata]
MKLNSSKLFFLTFMTVGVMMCLSSNNWIMIWCGLEMTLISFLPIMTSKMIISSESSIKYFLIQSISSAILILGLILMLINSNMHEFMISSAILLKMGVAPFHNWVLSIVEGLSFYSNMLMLTILKLAPLVLLSYTTISLVIIITITMLIGSIAGLNQTSTRKIMVYSSVFNMGLIIVAMKMNNFWMFYFMIYSTLVICVMIMFNSMNTNYVNQMIMNDKTLIMNISMWFLLLSLGGMPPFIGFSAKLIILEYMMSSMMIVNMIFIILCSLLVMFFYIRMTFMSIMFMSLKSKMKLLITSKSYLMVLIMNLMFLPLFLSYKSFC